MRKIQEQAAMYFHVEERRAWIRTQTHTVVYDRDPEYGRFAKDSTGVVKRMLRIWLAEGKGDKPYLRAYLGTVTSVLWDLLFESFTGYSILHRGQQKLPGRKIRHCVTALQVCSVCIFKKNTNHRISHRTA